MNRREFIAGLGSAAAWPLTGRAQQDGKMRRVGVLMPVDENDPALKTYVSAFTQALADLGWTDGRNVRMDLRFYRDDNNRARALAHELVGLQPDAILTGGTPATAAVQRETRTIPIVFVGASVQIQNDAYFFPNLPRPGSNITGFMEAKVAGKWVELLTEIAPGVKRIAAMFNPDTEPCVRRHFLPSFEVAARARKVAPIVAPVHSDAEIETVINALGREPTGGFVAMPDVFMQTHRASIILLAARYNVAGVYPRSEDAKDGGLLSYGVDQVDAWRRAATYVDRILRGAKPGDLPVQFSAKYELILNLKTAKALNLKIPAKLLAVADEVIE